MVDILLIISCLLWKILGFTEVVFDVVAARWIQKMKIMKNQQQNRLVTNSLQTVKYGKCTHHQVEKKYIKTFS